MPSDVASLALKLSQKTKRNGSRAMAYHFYAVNALKAGHPALARQAAGAVYKIYPGADPKRVGTLKAALVIDAAAMALNGKSKEAYRFLLKSMDRKANNKILLSIMSWAPGAFRPLLRDRAKLAFATGL